ncbi:MAG: glycosyltransferase family 39 protein [Chloroflexi bacterium]|nr:glycosyltransferase family 39 protein [Chloroflexota bacterium]
MTGAPSVIFSRPSTKKYAKEIFLLIFLLLFFFALSAMSIRGKSLTTDEYSHYDYGRMISNGDSTKPTDASMTKMPISIWNAIPIKIASYLPEGKIKSYLEMYLIARLMTTLFSMALGILVFKWSQELYGFIPAIASLILYLFDPNIIAHSQLTTNDVYAAGAITFATYRLWKFSRTHSWQDGLWLAFALGFAQLAKYTSISLYPLFAIALLVSEIPAVFEKYSAIGKVAVLDTIGRYLLYLLVSISIGILIINQYLRQLSGRNWFKGRMNHAQTGNLLENLGQ